MHTKTDIQNYQIDNLHIELGLYNAQSVTKRLRKMGLTPTSIIGRGKTLNQTDFRRLLTGFYTSPRATESGKLKVIAVLDKYSLSLLGNEELATQGSSLSDLSQTLSYAANEDKKTSPILKDSHKAKSSQLHPKTEIKSQVNLRIDKQPSVKIEEKNEDEPSHLKDEKSLIEPRQETNSQFNLSALKISFSKIPGIIEHKYFMLFIIQCAIFCQGGIGGWMAREMMGGGAWGIFFGAFAILVIEEMALSISLRSRGSWISWVFLSTFFLLGIVVGIDFHNINDISGLLTFEGVLAIGLPFVIFASSHQYIAAKLEEENDKDKSIVLLKVSQSIRQLTEAKLTDNEEYANNIIQKLIGLLPNDLSLDEKSKFRREIRSQCEGFCKEEIVIDDLETSLFKVFL